VHLAMGLASGNPGISCILGYSTVDRLLICDRDRSVVGPENRVALLVPLVFRLLASNREPLTLTLPGWQCTGESFAKEYDQEFQQFTRETGIRGGFLSSPQTCQQRLVVLRDLHGTQASTLDIAGFSKGSAPSKGPASHEEPF
jgi:hypothetical protein